LLTLQKVSTALKSAVVFGCLTINTANEASVLFVDRVCECFCLS